MSDEKTAPKKAAKKSTKKVTKDTLPPVGSAARKAMVLRGELKE